MDGWFGTYGKVERLGGGSAKVRWGDQKRSKGLKTEGMKRLRN